MTLDMGLVALLCLLCLGGVVEAASPTATSAPTSNADCGEREILCLLMRRSYSDFCSNEAFVDKAKKYCPRTCGYCHPTFEHGTNLIWSQSPYLEAYAVSKLVSIHGDPHTWVSNRAPKVTYIRAPYFNWEFRALGFHWAEQTLYWSESMNKKIQSLVLNSSTVTQTLFSGTSSEVYGIAIDWLSNNLYFTDALYNWIMMISALPQKKSIYRIIIQDGLDSPHGLAVHPEKGYLFWSDWGDRPKLEVSDLIGNSRRILVDRDIVKPRGLTIDYEENSLYWVDTFKATLEVVQFNGQGRKVLQTVEGSSFHGVALYKNFIFVTERTRGMLKVFDHQKSAVSFTLHNVPADIVMYDESRQPGNSSDCDFMGCEQLCVLDAVAGAKCLCGEGYLGADPDNITCRPSFQFVHPSHLYAIGDSICQYPANIADMSLANITLDSQCFLEDRQGYMTLTYDSEENMLYYFGNNTKTISRIPLEMGGKGKVVTGGTGVVKGMALDWSSGNIYWTDADQGHIKVSKKTGAYVAVVVDNINAPVGVAVHPRRGKLYWTDHGHLPDIGAKVESSNLDGSERKVIMGDNIGEPNHLFVDLVWDCLYWTDSILFHVRKVDLATGRITVVYEQPNVKFYGLSFFKDFILWTDTEDLNGIHIARMDKKTKVRGIIHPKNGIAADLITFDPLQQPKINNSCSEGVSKCSQLCLLGAGGRAQCACGTGYSLSLDEFTCITDPVMDNFLLLNDAYQRQIFQLNLNNGVVGAINLKPNHDPIALAYDPFEFRVFWSDNKASIIKQASIDGKYEKTVLRLANNSMCDGIAVDYINKLLFYTDTGNDVIGVVSMRNFDLSTPIVTDDMDEPRDIVVSPNDGIIYWSDWGDKPRIEKSNMDGSDREAVVTFDEAAWPNGLALDLNDSKLYWVDAHADSVSVIDLLTLKVTLLLEEKGSHFFSIDVMGDFLYITDWQKNYLRRMRKHGGELEKFGASYFTRLYGIVGYNSTEAFKGISVCVYSVCDQMCLPRGKDNYTCTCAKGYTAEGPRCIMETTPAPTPPIILPSGRQITVTRSVVNHSSSSPEAPSSTPLPPASSSPPPPSSSPPSSSAPLSSASSTPTTTQLPVTGMKNNSTKTMTTMMVKTTTMKMPQSSSTPSPGEVITKVPLVVTTGSEVTTSEVNTEIMPTTTKGSNTKITTPNNKKPSRRRSKQGASDPPSSLSTGVIVVIVMCILLVIAAVIVGVIFYRKRTFYKVGGHGKLIEEKNPSDFYKIAYPSPGEDAVTFDSGIENPTYAYLNGPGSSTEFPPATAQDGGASRT